MENGSNGETRMIKADRRLFQQFFLAKDLGKPMNCLGLFGIPLSLADTAGLQLHHTSDFFAIKPTPVTSIVPKAKKYVFSQLKQNIPKMNNICPIFKVGQHIKALALKKQLIPRLNLMQ